MIEVVFVRVAQTENNVLNIASGRKVDAPITASGAQLAERVGAMLKTKTFQAIYSGPAPRCIATARLVAQHHSQETLICEEFQEIDLGDFDGQKDEAIGQTSAGHDLFERPEHDNIPGSEESIAQAGSRAARKVRELVSHNKDGVLCIISHGGIIRAMICALLGLGLAHLWQFRQENCAVTVLRMTSHGSFELSELINHGLALST